MKPIHEIEPDALVDLRTCRPGDKLRSRHGVVLTYVRHDPPGHYPHAVKYPDGGIFLRTDGGWVSRRNSLPEDHDIVEILPRDEKEAAK